MRRTIFKLFFAWDFEKEEKWLNEMSAKGLQLIAVGFCTYVFEEAVKEEYVYRLELLENLPSNRQSRSYIRFIEETGAEYIGSVFRWAYFRKKASDGVFEINSDIESKVKHYTRIMTLFIGVTPINLFSVFFNLSAYMKEGYPVRLIIGIISSLLVLLLGLGIFKVSKQLMKFKKEKLIRE